MHAFHCTLFYLQLPVVPHCIFTHKFHHTIIPAALKQPWRIWVKFAHNTPVPTMSIFLERQVHRWLSARLQYLQCLSNRDTAVFTQLLICSFYRRFKSNFVKWSPDSMNAQLWTLKLLTPISYSSGSNYPRAISCLNFHAPPPPPYNLYLYNMK